MPKRGINQSIATYAVAKGFQGRSADFVLKEGAKRGRPNDLVSDSISRLKNGYLRRLDQVSLIKSKEILQLLESFLQCGYIQNYTSLKTSDRTYAFSKENSFDLQDGRLTVFLKYHQSLPAIRGIQRLSKPNKRLYFSKNNIIKVSQEQN